MCGEVQAFPNPKAPIYKGSQPFDPRALPSEDSEYENISMPWEYCNLGNVGNWGDNANIFSNFFYSEFFIIFILSKPSRIDNFVLFWGEKRVYVKPSQKFWNFFKGSEFLGIFYIFYSKKFCIFEY